MQEVMINGHLGSNIQRECGCGEGLGWEGKVRVDA